MNITEEEYLKVCNGYETQFNIHIRKFKEFEDQIKTLRELKQEYVNLFSNAEKKISEQSKEHSILVEKLETELKDKKLHIAECQKANLKQYLRIKRLETKLKKF